MSARSPAIEVLSALLREHRVIVPRQRPELRGYTLEQLDDAYVELIAMGQAGWVLRGDRPVAFAIEVDAKEAA